MFKKNNNKKILNWILVVIWMIVIFWSSSISDFSSVTGDEDGNDVVSAIVHIILYMVLAWLLIQAMLESKLSRAKAFFGAFIIAILYGATDEIHQYFVPGREPHLSDWLLDLVGAYLVLSLYTHKYRRKK